MVRIGSRRGCQRRRESAEKWRFEIVYFFSFFFRRLDLFVRRRIEPALSDFYRFLHPVTLPFDYHSFRMVQ